MMNILNGILGLLKNNANKLLVIPAAASVIMFAMDAALYYASGSEIDDNEYIALEQSFHRLVQGASGVDLIVLLLVMLLIKMSAGDRNRNA